MSYRQNTSTAQQAEIEMLLETIIELDTAVRSRFYQVNPAARRFRLQAQRTVGRALVET